MKQFGIFLIGGILLISFNIHQPGVLVKFQNDTTEDFKSLKVNIVGREFIFQELKKGEQTKQVVVPKTYKYCYAQAITSKNDTLLCLPEDFVGETLFTEGNFLISISLISKGEKYMNMKCKEMEKNFR